MIIKRNVLKRLLMFISITVGMSILIPVQAQTLRIAVISDSHNQIAQTSLCVEDIMQNVNFPKVDVLINGGDFHLHRGQCQYRESIRRGMEGDGQPYGWNDLHLPYYMVYGNHDGPSYERNPDKPYLLPETQNELGVMSPFYAFDYGNVLFLVVHSALGNTRIMEQPQKNWLKQITSENKDKTTVIFTHRTLYNSGTPFSDGRTYCYFQDTHWWADFFEENPQVLLYTLGHNWTGDLSELHRNFHGVNILQNAMFQHGNPNQMMLIELTQNSLLVRYWDAAKKKYVKTIMDEAVTSTVNSNTFNWFANAHIAQDGEKFTWHNRMLAENYKLKLIGEGTRGSELVWQNNEFSYYSPGTETASTLWIGYEQDENNQQWVHSGQKPYYLPGENGFVKFNGIDTFATATTFETKHTDNPVAHEGGHIPWSTTPWAVPGKEYKVRVRMKADKDVDSAMTVCVAVLGEDLTNFVMEKTPVIENINLTNSYQWYEGTFTVPNNEDAWIIKTFWESKQEDRFCYMDKWSVKRADSLGTGTADFWVDINGEQHQVSGNLPDGEIREFDLSPTTMQNDLDIEVGVGGTRVGMFTIVYENPYLWSDDATMGINSVAEDQVEAHIELISKYTPNAAFVPLQAGVNIAGANSLNVKPGYTSAQFLDLDELPGDFVVTYNGTDETKNPPQKATDPYPQDGASDISTFPDLYWITGLGASAHNIYFGTTNPPEFVETLDRSGIQSSFNPGVLLKNTTYFWRIDEVNSNDTTQGDVWQFSTMDAESNYYIFDACDQGTGWSSHNTLTINSDDNKQGIGCLQSDGDGTVEYKKMFSPAFMIDSTTSLEFWYYVSDVNQFQSANQVELGSAGGPDNKEYNWSINTSDLQNGWNYIILDFNDAGVTGGAPDQDNINWFRLYRRKNGEVTTMIDVIKFVGGSVNRIPVANAGPDQRISDDDGNGTEAVVLDGSGCNDYDGAIVDYSWQEDGIEIGNGVSPSVDLSIGSHTITLTATDDGGAVATDEVTIVIEESVSIDEKNQGIPDQYFLNQNYPNPFNPATVIRYGIKEKTQVVINIYNIKGEVVKNLVNGPKAAGNHAITWNVTDIPAGVYFYKIDVLNKFTDIKKCVFLK